MAEICFLVYLDSMLLAFTNRLKQHFPQVLEGKVLLAISGGIDSVVLAHLCRQSNLEFSLAHCNFNLRGQESQEDETFVVELADALNVEVFVESFQTEAYAEEKKISIQMAARELRYDWFEELRSTFHFDYIFTAHHANDNLETVLINLTRGTGLEGLTGIPETNGYIFRPLLTFPKETIRSFAEQSRLKWRDDSSNNSSKYIRNKVRNEVIPKLEEINPQLLDSFNNTIKNLLQSSMLIEDYISAIFPRIAKEEDFGYSFKIKVLKSIPNIRGVLYELFRSFGFSEWDDVFNLLDAQPGKVVYSKTHRLVKDREDLLLTIIPSEVRAEYQILEEEEVVMLPMGTFHLEEVKEVEDLGKNTVFLDKEKLHFPLSIRKWKKGDVFYPFGMQGKKKISKFFKDEKLSLPQKENCWLLCSDGKIIWIIGHRPDARYAVKDETQTILKLTYSP